MQSSTAIAIRALIMLIVLISVPLFAIFGKNLPDVVKGLLEGRGLVLGPVPAAVGGASPNPNLTASPPGGDALAQASPFRMGSDGKMPPGISATNTQPPALIGGHSSPPPTAAANNQIAAASSGVATSPSDLNATNPFVNPSTGGFAGAKPSNSINMESQWKIPPKADLAQPAGFQTPEGATPLMPPSSTAGSVVQNAETMSVSPDVNSNPANAGVRATAATGGVQAPLSATSDDRFRQAEQRLRELGATHYTLETWGPDNNRYRFVCKIAVGGNTGVNRYFQAIEDDPWQAMTKVVHEVEQLSAPSTGNKSAQ